MNSLRRWPLAYLAAVSIVFFVSYVLLGVRELGLALLLMALNLPASALILPLSERLAGPFGASSGSATHVLATQSVTMAVNALLLYAVLWAFRRITNR